MKAKEEKIRYYKEFTDDFEETANQNFELDSNYKWVRTDFKSKVLSFLIYSFALLFSSIYCPLFLHMRVKGRKNLKGIKGGFFIYGNHTQPFGDVFIPALTVFPRRIYTVVSPANYGIPVIGNILPYLGALPIVDSIKGFKELSVAMKQRLEKSHPIVIYPEAHVWEYCTTIRPFPDTSFKFPVKFEVPVFAMTVTYKKSRFYKKPKMTVYLDGPFYGEGNTAKEKVKNLHQKVYSTMVNRSQESNFEYIKYRKLK
ncbi:MAG: 1-acyl-sn-glycerol-3-phosphate acyltransferase [Ruminococcus sp.]|nr:1-acyl-sn-glycerol-3-phosphate acyltransferase [Ruminococcus sp.]